MRIPESCAKCLYDKQAHRVQNKEYLKKVKELIDHRSETDTSPYMVYQFNQMYEKMFGKVNSYTELKKEYNDLVLGIQNDLRKRIELAKDPLAMALQYARIGNYIDFGAMNYVDQEEFFSLFDDNQMNDRDIKVYQSFVNQCSKAKHFLLITDNCGEIVLDKLFVEQMQKRFSHINVTVLVRGGEVLNDATLEDAVYVGLDQVANVIDSGVSIAGTVYELLSDTARTYFDTADIILAKGQGNYESLSGTGRHIFYSFLCKCDLFMKRFDVPKLTGMLVEEC